MTAAFPPLKAISSMATQAVLAQLASLFEVQTGHAIHIESVGGVDAAKRVAAGEVLDVVLLASDAIDKLIASGHLAAPRTDWVRSAVAVAVPAGAPLLDISSEAALKAAVLAAPSISYSTGPSGNYLAKLFEQWGIADTVSAKAVTPPPGTPVAHLLASGQAALGFQQRSELIHAAGVQVLGDLPGDCAYVTTFSAAVTVGSNHAAAQSFLQFLNTPQTASVKQQQGMAAII